MKRGMAALALAFFVLGFAIPTVFADTSAFLHSSKDKEMRGIENGLFGMGGELYHHLSARGEKNALKGMSLGLWGGLHEGLVRTLVGAYEMATPFYHDKPLLSNLDSMGKS